MLLCCATRRFAACQLNAADERTLPLHLPLPLPPCEITYAAGGAQLFRQMPRETMRREGRRGRSLSRRRCRNGSVNGELKIHLLINFSQCQSVSRKNKGRSSSSTRRQRQRGGKANFDKPIVVYPCRFLSPPVTPLTVITILSFYVNNYYYYFYIIIFILSFVFYFYYYCYYNIVIFIFLDWH